MGQRVINRFVCPALLLDDHLAEVKPFVKILRFTIEPIWWNSCILNTQEQVEQLRVLINTVINPRWDT